MHAIFNADTTGKFKQRLSPARLRWSLLALFLIILLPFIVLVIETQRQMKWEAFYQYQSLADELAQTIDRSMQQIISREETFSYQDYQFFTVPADLQNSDTNQVTNVIQQSRLASFPVVSEVPGLIGYFQVDDQGVFSTPLLPNDPTLTGLSIAISNLQQRQLLQDQLLTILSKNQLVQPTAAAPAANNITATPNPASISAEASLNAEAEPDPQSGPDQDHDNNPASAMKQQLSESRGRLVQQNQVKSGASKAEDSPSTRVPASKEQYSGWQTNPESWDEGSMVAQTVPSSDLSRREGASYSQRVFDELRQPRPSQASGKSEPELMAKQRVDDLKLSKKAFEQARRATADDSDKSNRRTEAEPAPVVEQYNTIDSFEADSSTSRETMVNPPVTSSNSPATSKIRIFESELDPFSLALLDSGEFVLFRNVWRQGKRFIQGAIIDQEQFIKGTIMPYFAASSLSGMSDMVVAWQDNVLWTLAGTTKSYSFRGGTGVTMLKPTWVTSKSSDIDSTSNKTSGGESQALAINKGNTSQAQPPLSDTLLHQVRLSDPLSKMQLLWTINNLPAGPGARLVSGSSLVLFAALSIGFLMIYGLGMKQIRLGRQQQDFVSAVSHELKTPLTSIRMYGEMLREGWVAEDKKREYYDYIFDESERLSRLIANILQLARMERNDIQLDNKPIRCGELVEVVRAKIDNQIEKSGFQCQWITDPICAEQYICVDVDGFSQIIINLVDNALKFASKADSKRIDISLRKGAGKRIEIAVRDYGPGIAPSKIHKVFNLFYRAEDELTRSTTGTGIGLSLVQELTHAMAGHADVVNRQPGAEFRLSFPVFTPS